MDWSICFMVEGGVVVFLIKNKGGGWVFLARSTCCGWLENMLLDAWWTICFCLVGEHASGWLENMLWMVNMLLVGWFRGVVFI